MSFGRLFIWAVLAVRTSLSITVGTERLEALPGVNLFEGDILLNDDEEPQHNIRTVPMSKWPDGIVPYIMDSSINANLERMILGAMHFIESQTCVKFQQATDSDPHVVFIHAGKSCWSNIGRNTKQRKQDLSFGPACENPSIVRHELLHVLGYQHEQSRPDRDQYIRINYENVIKGKEGNFGKRSDAYYSTQNIPYNYKSLMHYQAYAGSTNDRPTIEPIDDRIPLEDLGSERDIGEYELLHIRKWYCGDDSLDVAVSPHSAPVDEQLSHFAQESAWSQWTSWSDCSVTCGRGNRVRTRNCKEGKQKCFGSGTEKMSCGMAPCSFESCGAPQSGKSMRRWFTTTHVGSKTIYECDEGMIRIGSPVRYCKPNLQWTGATPRCMVNAGPACPSIDSHFVNGHIHYLKTAKGNIKLLFFCDTGFSREGPHVIECLSSGRWSHHPPVCNGLA